MLPLSPRRPPVKGPPSRLQARARLAVQNEGLDRFIAQSLPSPRGGGGIQSRTGVRVSIRAKPSHFKNKGWVCLPSDRSANDHDPDEPFLLPGSQTEPMPLHRLMMPMMREDKGICLFKFNRPDLQNALASTRPNFCPRADFPASRTALMAPAM